VLSFIYKCHTVCHKMHIFFTLFPRTDPSFPSISYWILLSWITWLCPIHRIGRLWIWLVWQGLWKIYTNTHAMDDTRTPEGAYTLNSLDREAAEVNTNRTSSYSHSSFNCLHMKPTILCVRPTTTAAAEVSITLQKAINIIYLYQEKTMCNIYGLKSKYKHYVC